MIGYLTKYSIPILFACHWFEEEFIDASLQLYFAWTTNDFDTPPCFLKDLNASPKMKTLEEEGVGVCSLACSILGVEGCAWA
jgi:hypothetical protein